MRRLPIVTATAMILAATVPAMAHGPDEGGSREAHGRYQDYRGPGEGMMEMIHELAGRGGPGMMGDYGDAGMMGGGYGMMGGYGGPGMMQGSGPMGMGILGGMGHFGMSGAMFDQIDENGDGIVTPDEARGAHEARLKEFDADGDGTLSIDEFEKLHTAAIRELMVDRFQFLDANGDGKITQDEMNAPIDRMSRYMRMQDGYGPGMGRQDDDGDRPRQRMEDDDMPRGDMDDDHMPGMGGNGMMKN